MQLTVKSRQERNTKKIRRAGKIPAVLYSKGEQGENIEVDANEFKKILNKTPKGTLSSKVFELDVEGKKRKAIVKDIQYHVTTYNILHLDFEELHDDVPVKLNIPVQMKNSVDCVGVKLGGVLRQVIRQMMVKALPKDIPDGFEIDVLDMQLGHSKRLNEIAIPEGVTPVEKLDNVAVIVARR
ncbi:MAG: 50S ribosomal protein L25 [Chlamydiales bacterium]|nr:50S ribosomal protein L25 [Chlamydiales bacterium]MCH9635920.1 50S ribosomal protein L25 [Chlamydiales bacterium]